MNTFIDCLAFVMTLWMLYCFVRHGIYPAIRLVVRVIAAAVRLVAGFLQRERCNADAKHVAEVCDSLMLAPTRQRTSND